MTAPTAPELRRLAELTVDCSDGREWLDLFFKCAPESIDHPRRELVFLCQLAASLMDERDRLAAALRAVIEWQGIEHEDEDCPEDNTCRCPLVAQVNAAFRPAPSTNEPAAKEGD